MDEEAADITAWMGKPPEKPVRVQPDGSPTSHRSTSFPPSDSSSAGEVNYDGTPVKKRRVPIHEEDSDEDLPREQGEEDMAEVIPRFQQKFYIDIPKLDEEAKDQFDYLPGHFTVNRILSELSRDRYLVKLASGERQLVSLLTRVSLRTRHVRRLLTFTVL